MIKQVYSFQDMKVCVYHAPMVLLNDMEAKRLAADCVADSQTPMSRHSADFRLVRLGTFDDNNGAISPLVSPEWICDLNTLKNGVASKTEDSK